MVSREMTSIRHDEVFTATESDVLSDTDLRQAPGPGAIAIYAASDVNDSTITARVGSKQMASAIAVQNRGTGAPIDVLNDAPIAVTMVRGGENIRVDVTETTAMNLRLIALWLGATL